MVAVEKKQFGGMKSDEAKRLRVLEVENQPLKEMLAEGELEKRILKCLGVKLLSPARRCEAVSYVQKPLNCDSIGHVKPWINH